ncbi:1-phosphofructokinase family hexose kinase [Actinoallomurus acanthiterrae]
MIVTVTPNLALDVTYELPELRPGETHRVENVHARAGGKGVNVARVLHALGHDVLVVGPAGGPTGAALRADLDAAGLAHDLVPIAGETRRTVTVVAGGDATLLNEPGPTITPEEWAALEARIPDADVVVISGSLPPGVPADAVARLARRDARVIVDTSGEPLRHAAPYAWAVKPNAVELAELTGTADPVAGARSLVAGTGDPSLLAELTGTDRPGTGDPSLLAELTRTDRPVTGGRSLGAPAVVVSLGAEGLLAVVGDDVYRVAPPQVVTGNPTGAGDSVVAALAAGIGSPWPDLLKDAAALSAAAVLAPVAGAYDPAAYEGFRRCLSSPQERSSSPGTVSAPSTSSSSNTPKR